MTKGPMTRTQVLAVIAAAAIVAAGCGPKTIQTSSVEELERSLAEMREPLDREQGSRFDEALRFLVGELEIPSDLRDPAGAPTVLARFAPFAGLTVDAVISTAYIRRSLEVREAVAALETRRASSEETRRELAGFRLSEAHVFKRARGYLEWPVIELRVSNGTAHRVHLVRMHASLLASDDPEPWMEEELHQLMIDGLEPAAADLWRIEPEQREWIQLIDPHPHVSFHLEVVGLSGLGGTTFASTDWTAVDAHRLELYRATLETVRRTRRLCLDRPPSPAAGSRDGAGAGLTAGAENRDGAS